MTGAYDRHHYGDDLTSDSGAYDLAQRIREYWRKRGFTVEVRLVRSGFEPRARIAPQVIRSDLVNGLPREVVRQARAEGQAA